MTTTPSRTPIVNLILLEPHEAAAARAVLSDARGEHLLRVLRVTPGQQVRIGVVDGPRGTAVVRAIHDDAVELACELEPQVPRRPAVDLLLALPRPKVLRRLWAQLAAIGVGRIMLTNAARVERDYFDTHVLTPQSYRPLLIEGLQQARDTRLPVVTIHRRFRVLVEDELDTLCPDVVRLVGDPAASSSIDHAVHAATTRVLLAVGPEGGWNAFELALLERHGFQPISIGVRSLRTDTACIALLALTHAALERRLQTHS